MKNKLILTLDQGTTSSRAIVFNHAGEIVSFTKPEQLFPKPGWVEHDPKEVFKIEVAEVIAKVIREEIAAIGITNQRETTIVWDGKPANPL
jgi:glycerol kinase